MKQKKMSCGNDPFSPLFHSQQTITGSDTTDNEDDKETTKTSKDTASDQTHCCKSCDTLQDDSLLVLLLPLLLHNSNGRIAAMTAGTVAELTMETTMTTETETTKVGTPSSAKSLLSTTQQPPLLQNATAIFSINRL